MEPERIEPDPRELDALQRAVDSQDQIDDGFDSPEPIEMPEIPAAAGQPDFAAPQVPDVVADVQAPEIAAPAFDDEVLRPALDEIPDISSTPKRRKLSAQQKRNGQVEPPPEPPLPDPDPEDHPRQQPPEPVAPNPDDLRAAANHANAIDQDGVIDFNRVVPPHAEAADGNKQAEIQAEKGVNDKVIGIETTRLQILQEYGARLDKLESEYRKLLAGNMRRRG